MIRRRRHRSRSWRDDERGIVIIYFAMTLVVLMLMAGFAVDVGAWYKRGQQIQRAADAAALAGVVYMPGDFATAESVARKVATANGFTDGVNGIHVNVSEDTVSVRRLQVTIKDDAVPQYFTKVAMSAPNETRTATGEYVTPIPLGSPENAFGTDNLACGTNVANGCKNIKPGFWAAVDGYCTSKEDGDRYSAQYDSNRQGPPTGRTICPSSVNGAGAAGASINSEYRTNGYTFDIDIPTLDVSATTIQVYDAAFLEGSVAGDSTVTNTSNIGCNGATNCPAPLATVTTHWRLLGPDATPFDNTDNPQVAPTTCVHYSDVTCQSSSNEGTWASGDTTLSATTGTSAWTNLKKSDGTDYYVPAGSTGVYRLLVYTQSSEANSWGTNAFGVRANIGTPAAVVNKFNSCTTLGTGGANNTCPSVHGEDAMSIFVNDAGSGCGSYHCSTFDIAQIDQSYAGKTLNISLFDPGEGAVQMEVLDDNRNVQSVTWDTKDTWYNAGYPNYSGSGTTVTGFNTTVSALPNHSSTSEYSDRVLQIHVPIPANYVPHAAANGNTTGEGWWQIKYYYSGTSVADRTTWSISLSGNPVHLVT